MGFKLGQKIIDRLRNKEKKIKRLEENKRKEKNNKIIYVDEHNQEHIIYNIENLTINFYGSNSTVKVHHNCQFNSCNLSLGNNNLVEFGKDTWIDKLSIPLTMSDYSKLIIGENFKCCGANIFMHDEPNNNIIVGNDCLFSFDITLWPSDGHTIIDLETSNVINKSISGIKIEDHVWIGRSVSVLKNSKIPKNCVVGTNSIINKNFQEQNCILAGTPAKIIKRGINWDIKGIQDYELSNNKI